MDGVMAKKKVAECWWMCLRKRECSECMGLWRLAEWITDAIGQEEVQWIQCDMKRRSFCRGAEAHFTGRVGGLAWELRSRESAFDQRAIRLSS